MNERDSTDSVSSDVNSEAAASKLDEMVMMRDGEQRARVGCHVSCCANGCFNPQDLFGCVDVSAPPPVYVNRQGQEEAWLGVQRQHGDRAGPHCGGTWLQTGPDDASHDVNGAPHPPTSIWC